MLKVIDLATRSGATPHAIRYYTRMGLLRPRRNPDNGYHIYDYHDVRWLRFIQQAKRLGYTLNEIREIMHDTDAGQSPCQRVREILQCRVVENHRKMEELTALQDRMELALEQWSGIPDCDPDGDSVCHLIEAFAECDSGHPGKQH
ncbi:MAG: MerR family transcriptional regulator [Gammaproteobacteria bacterium]|nr:MerR family transcriptional regulator [Gammaproteobacteria bacterium]